MFHRKLALSLFTLTPAAMLPAAMLPAAVLFASVLPAQIDPPTRVPVTATTAAESAVKNVRGATETDTVLANWLLVTNDNTIALARLAKEKAQGNDVKQFAQMVMDEHTQFALQAQLAVSSARLAEYSKAHGHFVDGLAHRIRTPLTILMNQAELLLRCSDDPAAVALHARGIADYLLHLSDLVEGFVRLGSPLLVADKSHHLPVHVHDLVIEAVRRSQSTARNREVHVVATIPEPDGEDRSLEVLGSEVLLAAMIESLLRDAVRRSPHGAHVELQVQVRGESILLRVRDRGTAIAPSQLESVFDWYFEPPGAERDSHRTGNLAIARRVADHHSGTISLRNHPEGGCEFEITLPRWRDPAPRPADAALLSADATLRSDGTRSPARTPPLVR